MRWVSLVNWYYPDVKCAVNRGVSNPRFCLQVTRLIIGFIGERSSILPELLISGYIMSLSYYITIAALGIADISGTKLLGAISKYRVWLLSIE